MNVNTAIEIHLRFVYITLINLLGIDTANFIKAMKIIR